MAAFEARRNGRLTEAAYIFVIFVIPAFAGGILLALVLITPAANTGAAETAVWIYFIGALAALLAFAAYEAWSTSTGRPRWRDARAGVRVVRLRDGQPPGFTASFGRSILPVAAGTAGFVFGGQIPWAVPLDLIAGPALWALVYATAFRDDHGRGWHDKLAGTVVIEDTSPRADWWTKRDVEGAGDAAG